MEFIYFGDHGPTASLTTPMVVVGAVSSTWYCIYYENIL